MNSVRRLLNLVLVLSLAALAACRPIPAPPGHEGPLRYDPQAHVLQGVLHYLAGDFDAAIAAFDEAIRLDPINVDALSGRAHAYFGRGVANGKFDAPRREDADLDDLNAAMRDYDEVIRIKPSKADAYYNRGLAYLRRAPYSKGQAFVTEYGSAVAVVNTIDLQKAISDFTEAIRLHAMHISPDDPRPYLARAIAQRALRQSEEAFQDFNEAIRLDPAYAEAYLQRGFAHYTAAGAHYMLVTGALDRAELGAAIDDFTAAIRLRPSDAEAYFRRGLAYAGLGQYATAITDYDEAIRQKPDHTNALYHRGLAYAQLGDPDAAIQDFTEAIQLSPGHTDAYYHRGLAYAILGDHTSALCDFDEAVRLKSHERWLYYHRGLAHAALGNYPAAVQDYADFIAKTPGYARAFYNRGLAYAEIGDREAALDDLETALTLVEPGADLAADINAALARLHAGD